ncbi:hypothetical protein [Bradyrhizobium liaoningense]|uniref:hypothetical protein n=1 Tax=Bradyrhizobium liaoningense TaxID=43992 RepID=UPI0004AD6D5F|nr:hypothetical protein [Bradyrhizobium liaoningense]
MRHPLDIVAMFAALWLLASMVLNALTPKELTAVMIAVAIGPAIIITAVFYYLRCPRTDFAVMFACAMADLGYCNCFRLSEGAAAFPDRARFCAGAAGRHRAALAALPAPP